MRLIHPGRPNEHDLYTSPAHPVEVHIEATNAELDRTTVLLDAGSGSEVEFNLIPNILDSSGTTAVQIRLTIPANPSAPQWTRTYQVRTTDNTRTWTGPLNQAPSRTRDVRIHMSPVHGLIQGKPQRGWTLAMLDEGFQIALTDGQNSYDKELGPNDPFYGLGSMNPPAAEIHWTGDGEFRTQNNFSAQPVTRAPVGQRVWFTPRNSQGPWRIRAEFSGNLYDPNAPTFAWVNNPGDPVQRNRQNGMTVTVRRDFYVQGPERIEIEDVVASATSGGASGASGATSGASGASGGGVRQLETGRRYKMVAHGLSPLQIPASHPGLRVTSWGPVYGRLHQWWSGYPFQFDRRVPIAYSTNKIESQPFRLIQGRPDPVPSGLLLATVPGGEVRFAACPQDVELPVLRRRRQRLMTPGQDGVPTRQENLAGTTPAVGLFDSVNPRTGEVIYRTMDLERVGRFEPLAVERVYRSHLVEPDESLPSPLGPGWTLGWDSFLTLSRSTGQQFYDDTGRVDGFDRKPPVGTWSLWRKNRQLGSLNSAYEWVMQHHDIWHYDVDGFLRLVEDRQGGRLQLVRDSAGRLIRVKDAMAPGVFGPSPIASPAPDRHLVLTYYEEGSAPHDEWVGRLKEIEDWAGAKITYLYYAPGENGGAPGMLKQVQMPEVPTWNGTALANTRRTESYEYVQQNGHWLLYRVRDGLNRIVLENTYQDGRVTSQKNDGGSGTVSIAWDAAAGRPQSLGAADLNSDTPSRYPYSAGWGSNHRRGESRRVLAIGLTGP